MESKRRPSFDDAGSALRRLTHTPRLGFRRPVSTSSSASSIASHEYPDEITACVYSYSSRNDDCALNKFIVWAAVKRNACHKMTPEERRECPLLRCRKRFPNHEIMLQHLYTCDQLAVGEYWCYNCIRVEKFSDAKCRKCLGHLSRSRRIMGMAKNFFNSLGHRGRNGSLLELDLEDEEGPPSYRVSLDVAPSPVQVAAPPMQVELQDTEIYEIDSYELPLPSILENEPDATMELYTPPPMPPFAELESVPMVEGSLIGWQPSPQPPTIAPATLMNTSYGGYSERPALQLHTSGLEQYRAQAKAQAKSRSKNLAPSSSVRSTASTDSTNSYVSTASYSSAASYNISPMSAFSEGWARVHGLDSTLSSPVDNLSTMNPHKPLDAYNYDFNETMQDSFLLGSPADVPMLDVTAPSGSATHSLDIFPAPSPFYASGSLTPGLSMKQFWTMAHGTKPQQDLPHLETNLPLRDDSKVQRASPSSKSPSSRDSRISAHSLVSTAWEALKMHVEESINRLKDAKKNIYVDQLRDMSTDTVALVGLETLVRILEGDMVESPVDLICFVHLIYSFSLVVHEQEAPDRGGELFSQAVSYSSWLTREEQQGYLPIVDLLWKPPSMSDSEALGLMRKASAASRFASVKGKHPQNSLPHQSNDSLVLVAQFFLDELEHSALTETNRLEIQASDLCTWHLRDSNLASHQSSSFDVAIISMHQTLLNEYAKVPRLKSTMEELFRNAKTECGLTPRRLELELMQAGKMSLPPGILFNGFIPCVRAQIDSLQGFYGTMSRLVYYRSGVKLIQSILKLSDQGVTCPNKATQIVSGIDSLTSNGDNFNFGSFVTLGSSSPLGIRAPLPDITIDSSSETPNTYTSNVRPSTAATSPPSPAPTPSTGNRTGADDCCDICGYRPEGDPRWFPGSMAKHKKLQHATSPPMIYRCRFPGCTSQYKNRPDNLRQHQIKKGHFVKSDDEFGRRPSKRKKID